MKNFFNKYFWTLLVVIAAVGLAGSAAYFSISGLSKLFGGSAMQVIIMASFIEFGKLVTTAALHRYWKKTIWWMRYILTAMIISVMVITSSGIYGFLADAYASTSIELEKIDGKIALIEKQQEQKNTQIEGIDEIKDSKSNRIVTLNNLRVQQEARIDSLYSKGWYSSARKTQVLIDQSTAEIQKLQTELDTIAVRVNVINQEIGDLDISILDLQNSDVATEIGPLKYMSTVVNRPMEDIINWFILMLIFVFDPLAVLLIIFASNIYDANNKGNGPPEDDDSYDRELTKEELEGLFKILQRETDNNKVEELASEIDFEEVGYEEDDDETIDISEIIEEDVPEEKGEEVVEYVEAGNGDFKKSEEPSASLAALIKGIDSNPIYLRLLEVLFDDGKRGPEDTIPPYKSLVKEIAKQGIVCEDKVIKNFLTICNLLDITNMSDKDSVKIVKDYSTSKGIVSLVSK